MTTNVVWLAGNFLRFFFIICAYLLLLLRAPANCNLHLSENQFRLQNHRQKSPCRKLPLPFPGCFLATLNGNQDSTTSVSLFSQCKMARGFGWFKSRFCLLWVDAAAGGAGANWVEKRRFRIAHLSQCVIRPWFNCNFLPKISREKLDLRAFCLALKFHRSWSKYL